MSNHYLAAAGSSRPAVRASEGVVDEEPYFFRRDPQRRERTMGRANHSNIRALSMLFPGVVKHDAAVRQKFDIVVCLIGSRAVGIVNAKGDADALLYLLGAPGLCPFYSGPIFRAQNVDHLGKREYIRRLTEREGLPWAYGVDIAEFQRIHPHSLSQHIDRYLLSRVHLRRAPGSERRIPFLICIDAVSRASHIGNAV